MSFVTIFIPRSCTSSYLVTLVKTCIEVLDLQTFCDVCIRRLSVNYRDQHLDRFVFLPFSYIYSDLYVDIIVFCSCEYPPK